MLGISKKIVYLDSSLIKKNIRNYEKVNYRNSSSRF